jgi:hypothetical protein
MKILVALACAGWLTVPHADPPNTLPLAFGMTPQDAAAALGAPLAYHHGGPGNEVFSAIVEAPVPGLQFRRGCLTGWKNDWRRTPRGFL